MEGVTTASQNLLAGVLGLIIAAVPTYFVSYLVLPPDGPIGEGFLILFIYFVSCCVCVPGYIALMAMHRQGAQSTRWFITSEIILRASAVVAACLISFLAIKLPKALPTK